MNLDEIEKEMASLRKRLKAMQKDRRKLNPKPKSDRPTGRPCIDPKRIEMARELAYEYPITHVALKMGIALSTLYRYGIKRKLLRDAFRPR